MTASAWTDDRVDRLRILWREGRTADQIAHDLANGISRSAVLGKVYRMGLSAGRHAAPAKPPPQAHAGPRREVRPVLAIAIQVDQAPDPETGLASLMSVRRQECRWPLGDPFSPAFSLCGRPAVRGAYCGPHARIAYRRAADTPRSLERLARLP